MQTVRLNVFQRLIRTWEAAHPYNAAQVLKIAGSLNPCAVENTWHQVLAELGLGRVTFTRSRLQHEALNGTRANHPVHVLKPDEDLETYLAHEMDRPFGESADSPFRPFLLPGDDASWFGVTYRHCVADSVSIRSLLGEFFSRIITGDVRQTRPAVHEHDGYWRLFSARNGTARLEEALLSSVRSHCRFRKVLKPITAGRHDYPSRVMLRHAPDGLVSELRHTCRSKRVRPSDVMLAALAQAAQRHVPLQRRPKREDVAVVCVVDLRPHASPKINGKFGLFLGFTSVICRPREMEQWPTLLESVQRQTALHRRRGIAASSTTWMSAALAWSRIVPPHRVYHSYRKEMPNAAGLSSVNLDQAWPMSHFPSPLLDYVRISPTGPMAPVVLSATALGPRLSLALTYRPAIVTRESANALLDDFIDRLRL